MVSAPRSAVSGAASEVQGGSGSQGANIYPAGGATMPRSLHMDQWRTSPPDSIDEFRVVRNTLAHEEVAACARSRRESHALLLCRGVIITAIVSRIWQM